MAPTGNCGKHVKNLLRYAPEYGGASLHFQLQKERTSSQNAHFLPEIAAPGLKSHGTLWEHSKAERVIKSHGNLADSVAASIGARVCGTLTP